MLRAEDVKDTTAESSCLSFESQLPLSGICMDGALTLKRIDKFHPKPLAHALQLLSSADRRLNGSDLRIRPGKGYVKVVLSHQSAGV